MTLGQTYMLFVFSVTEVSRKANELTGAHELWFGPHSSGRADDLAWRRGRNVPPLTRDDLLLANLVHTLERRQVHAVRTRWPPAYLGEDPGDGQTRYTKQHHVKLCHSIHPV